MASSTSVVALSLVIRSPRGMNWYGNELPVASFCKNRLSDMNYISGSCACESVLTRWSSSVPSGRSIEGSEIVDVFQLSRNTESNDHSRSRAESRIEIDSPSPAIRARTTLSLLAVAPGRITTCVCGQYLSFLQMLSQVLQTRHSRKRTNSEV